MENFWESVGGSFTDCVKKVKGAYPSITDADSFCASLKDYIEGTTYWRGKESALNFAEFLVKKLSIC